MSVSQERNTNKMNNKCKKVKKLVVMSDENNGWLRVRRNDRVFKFIADKVSTNNRHYKEFVYLEKGETLQMYVKESLRRGHEIIWDSRYSKKYSVISTYPKFIYEHNFAKS